MNSATRRSASGVIVLSLVWLGLLLGVSFVATPAKFLAPSLDLAVALDVGRHTFDVFTTLEVAVTVALVALALVGRRRDGLVLATLATLIVVAEKGWLLPSLDARVETIMHGGVPGESALHTLYIALEIVKAIALILLARVGFRLRYEHQGGR